MMCWDRLGGLFLYLKICYFIIILNKYIIKSEYNLILEVIMPVQNIEFYNENFEAKIVENLIVIKLKSNVFEAFTNLSKNQEVIPYFELLSEKENINGILIINDEEALGENAYYRFLSSIADIGGNFKNPEIISKFKRMEIRAIEINMLENFIKKLLKFDKLVVAALQGEIVTPFFGLSLAFDLRFGREDMTFNLSHTSYGIHPSGALPFFLPRYIGQGNATEYLLRGGVIDASLAYKLGLLNFVVNKNDFEKIAIEETIKICSINFPLIKSTKDLLHDFNEGIDKYFLKERNYLYK